MSNSQEMTAEARKRRLLVEKTIKELDELGVDDFDIEPVKHTSDIEGQYLLNIINKIRKGNNFEEVETATRMIKGRRISSRQAVEVIKAFHCPNIHWEQFILNILPNIVDPKNLKKDLRRVSSIYEREIRELEDTIKAIYPDGDYLKDFEGQVVEIKEEVKSFLQSKLATGISWTLMIINIILILVLYL